ncbi:hypothetical protein [Algoriphagus machipongonensis]|nr:hypothetical protein [Algoriphagus machipongonensis]
MDKGKTLTQKDNLVFQSHCMVAFIQELANANFLKSPSYEWVKFNDKDLKFFIRDQIGILNQGTVLLFLYAMLVVPKELIHSEYQVEFGELESWLKERISDFESTYKNKQIKLNEVNLLDKIRNSVSHATVVFHKNLKIEFVDNYGSSNTSFKLLMTDFPEFLQKLQNIFKRYFEQFRSK